jgi:hypothetical protein
VSPDGRIADNLPVTTRELAAFVVNAASGPARARAGGAVRARRGTLRVHVRGRRGHAAGAGGRARGMRAHGGAAGRRGGVAGPPRASCPGCTPICPRYGGRSGCDRAAGRLRGAWPLAGGARPRVAPRPPFGRVAPRSAPISGADPGENRGAWRRWGAEPRPRAATESRDREPRRDRTPRVAPEFAPISGAHPGATAEPRPRAATASRAPRAAHREPRTAHRAPRAAHRESGPSWPAPPGAGPGD